MLLEKQQLKPSLFYKLEQAQTWCFWKFLLAEFKAHLTECSWSNLFHYFLKDIHMVSVGMYK